MKTEKKNHEKTSQEVKELKSLHKYVIKTKETENIARHLQKLEISIESLEKEVQDERKQKEIFKEENTRLLHKCKSLDETNKQPIISEALYDTKGHLPRVTEERDNLVKQLKEAQVVEKLGKPRTTTFQDLATSPRESEWKGGCRLRISIVWNSIRNQRRKQCFKDRLLS